MTPEDQGLSYLVDVFRIVYVQPFDFAGCMVCVTDKAGTFPVNR